MTENATNYPNIALAGPAAVGKTTIATILQHEFGYSRVSFASPIKNLLFQAYGTDHKDARIVVFDRTGAAKTTTIGVLCQMLGTEAIRNNVDQAFWLRCMESQLKETLRPWVIDDLRFRNEAKWAEYNGFHVVRLAREREPRPDGRDPAHQSEIEATTINTKIIIPNVGTPLQTTRELVRILAIEEITRRALTKSDGS